MSDDDVTVIQAKEILFEQAKQGIPLEAKVDAHEIVDLVIQALRYCYRSPERDQLLSGYTAGKVQISVTCHLESAKNEISHYSIFITERPASLVVSLKQEQEQQESLGAWVNEPHESPSGNCSISWAPTAKADQTH